MSEPVAGVASDPVRSLDLEEIHRPLRAELTAAHARVLASGHYLLGPELEALERAWAEACGTDHAVGVGSGLDALVLTLRALDIGPGDDVLVPSNTFIATWLAVSAVGARPIPVEPDPATHLVTAEAMAAAVTPRTTAMVPVHLYGLPVDVQGMARVAEAHGLALVHDAAQAHGATVGSDPVGRFGHASAWSFYPGKNLGALGDAGAVTTDDAELAERLRRLRNYGSGEKYVYAEKGANSRLDEIGAAHLRVLLPHLPAWNRARAEVAAHYDGALSPHAGPDLALPTGRRGTTSSWHQYVVSVAGRDELRTALAERGIETGIHYPVPPHRQAAYAELGMGPGSLPVAEALAARVLSLPIGPHVTPERRRRVVDALLDARADGTAR